MVVIRLRAWKTTLQMTYSVWEQGFIRKLAYKEQAICFTNMTLSVHGYPPTTVPGRPLKSGRFLEGVAGEGTGRG